MTNEEKVFTKKVARLLYTYFWGWGKSNKTCSLKETMHNIWLLHKGDKNVKR